MEAGEGKGRKNKSYYMQQHEWNRPFRRPEGAVAHEHWVVALNCRAVEGNGVSQR